MKQLNRIFFIYTEASLSVFLLCIAAIELLCALVTPEPIRIIAFGAAALFTAIALSCVLYIHRQEAKWNARINARVGGQQ